MKTTAKAIILKKYKKEKINKIEITKDKLIKSRLFNQLNAFRSELLFQINRLLLPITRQGHSSVEQMEQKTVQNGFEPNSNQAWFVISQNGNPLLWWGVDRSTLDQLASSYYGSVTCTFKSPLREPTNSEIRLAQKVMTNVLSVISHTAFDQDELEINLLSQVSDIKTPLLWQLKFSSQHCGNDMYFCLNEHLLSLLSQQPLHDHVCPELPQKLAMKSRKIPFSLSVQVGTSSASVQQLSSLKAGDLLPLNLHAKCPVSIGNTPIFKANIFTHQGQMVAKLVNE